LLNLATDKAFHFLKWQPVWDFSRTIEKTISWYRRYAADPGVAAALTSLQISDYTADARRLGMSWNL
jgi:CDP-glucose 4,6-dehydratase